MNRTITPTPALTGHPSARRRSLRHAALVALCAALVALGAAACTADTLDGRQPDAATDPDVLTFAVGPRPGFTEAAATRGTDTKAATKAVIPGNSTVIPGLTRDLPNQNAAPSTRAVQTPGATRWEQGDVLWLAVYFYRDRQNTALPDTICASALKYDVDKWRYLTQAEAEDLNTGNLPGFSRLVRWPRGWKDWVDPGMEIYAWYAGSGTPDADGKLTVTPDGTLPVTHTLGATGKSAPGEEPVSLRFHSDSRIRIPAGYTVKFDNFNYIVAVRPGDGSIDLQTTWDSSIPAPQEDTYVFLQLGWSGNSTATLTRDNVSCTFTFPRITDAEGYPTWNGVSYTLTPYTSGAETPGGYDLTIADEAGLRAFAQAVNAGDRLPNGKPAAEARVLQTADIHLTQGEWVPIGIGRDNQFRGAYNGNGHEITGLTITTAQQPDALNDSYAGLFGYAEGAVLTGIKLRGVGINITDGGGTTDLSVGSIAGWLENSTLSLCSADGTVNASGGATVNAGGIAGYSEYSTISRCRADVETTAASAIAFVGGIAGYNESFSFILSCESGDRAVTAEGRTHAYTRTHAYAGGIAGHNAGHSFIAFCRKGKNVVTARNAAWENYAGGLVGENGGNLYSCYSRATATATGTGEKRAGAIIGYSNSGVVGYCYGTGATGEGTSKLAAKPDEIVYNTDPKDGDIFRVMTGYTGKVESITSGDTYYPFTTTSAPSATPAYGIIPRRAVWTKDAWKDGTTLLYPEINMEYGGDNNP